MTTDIQRAVNLLSNGDLVAFPTETVYGLGGDATNAAAVEKIFRLKRAAKQPSTHHACGLAEQAMEYAHFFPSSP